MHKRIQTEEDCNKYWAQFNKDAQKAVDEMEPITLHTSSHLRALNREGYELSLAHIISLAKGEIAEAPYSAHIRAHETLAKHGIGNKSPVIIESREMLSKIYIITANFLDDLDKFKEWLTQLHAAFRYPQ